jgi:peptide chain release factor 3
MFAIGDTVSETNVGAFAPLPRFSPEHFAMLRANRADKYKQFLKGLTQIEEEGAIQLFYPVSSGRREPIMAAVGALQFDVVQFRLLAEYTVETAIEGLSFSAVRWVTGDAAEIASIGNGRGRMRAEDRGRPGGDPLLDAVGPALRRGERGRRRVSRDGGGGVTRRIDSEPGSRGAGEPGSRGVG